MKVNLIHRLSILLILLIFSGNRSDAQWYKWHIGVGGGAMSYYGDLSDKFVNLNLQEPAYHAFIERYLRSSVYLRLESVNGHLLGSDRAPGGWLNRDLDGNDYFARSLNFRTRVHDANLSLVFYLIPKGERERAPFISPYFRLGVGVGYFDVFGDLLNENGDRYYYWSDLSIRDRAEDAPDADQAIRISRDKNYETKLRELALEKNYNRFKWQIPAAVGLRMRLAENLSLMLEAQFTYAMTDYLDNVGDLAIRPDISDPFLQYAADPAGFIGEGPRAGNRRKSLNDAYLYLNAGLAFNIGSTAPPKFKAPRFYPSVLKPGPVEVPVPSDHEALFDSLPAIVEAQTEAVDTVAAFTIAYPQWQQLRAIALSYEEVLDSLYLADIRASQDSLLKEDLRQYAQLLPGTIPSNVRIDSIAMSKVSGSDNRVVLQYFISMPESIYSEDSLESTIDSNYFSRAFAYRVDTLIADSPPFRGDSTLIVSPDDPEQRKLMDSVYFKSSPLASQYRIPTVIGAPVDTAPFTARPDTAAGMRYERLSFPEIKSFKAPILPMQDTVFIKDRLMLAEPTTDSILIQNIEALKQRIDALQPVGRLKDVAAPTPSKDTLLLKKLEGLELQMKAIKEESALSRTTTTVTASSLPQEPTLRKDVADSTLDKMQRMINQLAMQRSASDNLTYPGSPLTTSSLDKLSRAERRAIRQDAKTDRTPLFVAYSNPSPVRKMPQAEEEKKIEPIEVEDSVKITQDSLATTIKDTMSTISETAPAAETNMKADTINSQMPQSPAIVEENRALKIELDELRKGQDSLMTLLNKVFEKMATPAPVTVVAPPSLDPVDIVLRQGPVRVFFGVGKSAVASQYKAGLDGLAEQLRKYPEINVEIKGFADPTGNAAANMLLSEKRAQSVQQYLVKTHRISSDRIVILPVGQEADSQDMSYSRRVEVKLIRK